MKTKTAIFALMSAIMPVYSATAVLECGITMCTGAGIIETATNTCSDLVSGTTSTCYTNSSGQKYKVYNCAHCSGGKQLTDVPISEIVPGCRNMTTTVKQCCTACDTCTSDDDFTAVNTGYERKAVRSCDCTFGCRAIYSYRCAAGYYGASLNGTSGCTACPNGGTSVAGSNTSITSCYLPAGTKFSDTSGSGEYTENCHYTE